MTEQQLSRADRGVASTFVHSLATLAVSNPLLRGLGLGAHTGDGFSPSDAWVPRSKPLQTMWPSRAGIRCHVLTLLTITFESG